MIVRSEKRPSRVRDARSHAREVLPDRAEPIELAPVDRRRRLVRAGEVAHQQRHVEPGPPVVAGEQGVELLPDETEPVDPGVDVECRTARRAMGRGTADPSIDAIQIEQARNQAVLLQDVRLVADARHEHEDLHVAEGPPNLDRLAAEPGEERTAAGRVQGARNLRGPEPVAVRLDHAGDLRGGKRCDGPVVSGQRGEIHDQTGRGVSFITWAEGVDFRLAHVRSPSRRSRPAAGPGRPGARSPRTVTAWIERWWRPRVPPISIPPGPSRTLAERPRPPSGAPP